MPRQKKGPLGGILPTIRVHSARGTRLMTLQPLHLLYDHGTSTTSVNAEIDVPMPDIAERNVDDDSDDESMTKYQQAKLNEMAKWTSVRDGMLEAAMSEACPSVTSCVLCHSDNAFVRCQDCGPMYFVCCQCAEHDHQYRQFHTMEIFKVGSIIYFAVINYSSFLFKLISEICILNWIDVYRLNLDQ